MFSDVYWLQHSIANRDQRWTALVISDKPDAGKRWGVRQPLALKRSWS